MIFVRKPEKGSFKQRASFSNEARTPYITLLWGNRFYKNTISLRRIFISRDSVRCLRLNECVRINSTRVCIK